MQRILKFSNLIKYSNSKNNYLYVNDEDVARVRPVLGDDISYIKFGSRAALGAPTDEDIKRESATAAMCDAPAWLKQYLAPFGVAALNPNRIVLSSAEIVRAAKPLLEAFLFCYLKLKLKKLILSMVVH